MPQTRALSPRARLDTILRETADVLGPLLVADDRVSQIKVSVERNEQVPISELRQSGNQWLDPLQCLNVLSGKGARHLFYPDLAVRANEAAFELKELRNAHAHKRRTITDQDVHIAKVHAQFLVRLFGAEDIARRIEDLALPPAIRYVADLRSCLITIAQTKNDLLTYKEARDVLGLEETDVGFRVLFRQLNVLAAKQMLLGEPQLCALVVDAETLIPGSGFYWIVNVDRTAADEIKRAAHAKALADVRRYDWKA